MYFWWTGYWCLPWFFLMERQDYWLNYLLTLCFPFTILKVLSHCTRQRMLHIHEPTNQSLLAKLILSINRSCDETSGSNVSALLGWSRDGHGSGRPAGRVGSRVSIKANLAGRVGFIFLKCIIFFFIGGLNNFTYCSENWVLLTT